MRPIRHILVAVKDPSARSLPAVTKAGQLAHVYGATLELFHGISTPLYVDAYAVDSTLPSIERRVRQKCVKELERAADKLRRTGLKVTTDAEWDHPVFEAIVRRANRTQADLIVAERHLGHHVAPGLLQLTDWELLRTSPVPVLLVKTAGRYRRPVVLAAIDPTHAYAKPADLDQEILDAARSLTRSLHGAMHAVHAYIPVPTGAFPDTTLTEATVDKIQATTTALAKRGFSRALRNLKLPRGRQHLVGRHPIDAIEQTAGRIHSALVVMGAISRSGLKRLFIGNTAEALLDRLPCDILIVKSPHFATAIPRRSRGVRLAALAAVPAF